MKAVLISIQPKWCELIASGKKTIEVRKTRPKLETPFKCYIYCTSSELLIKSHRTDEIYVASKKRYKSALERNGNTTLSGKVIGEFVCDEITEFESELWDNETYERITRVVHKEDWEGYHETESYYVAEDGEKNYLCDQSCLTWEDLRSYVGQGIHAFFGWHISDLVIYDKLKELGEFWTFKCANKKGGCGGCAEKPNCIKHITRPPQSWCYVEELT